MRERINELIEKKKFTEFVLHATDEPEYGYPLKASDEWILVHTVHVFHLDGYTALRMREIKEVVPEKRNSGHERIHRFEGIKAQVGIDIDLNLSSSASLLRSLARAHEPVMLTFFSPEGAYCHLGKIIRINKKSVAFKIVDTQAVWASEDERLLLKYEDIGMISFRQEYLECFVKHARTNRAERK